MLHVPRPRPVQLAAATLYVLFAVVTLLWLSLDRHPPNWDDAWYLTNSLTVYDSLGQGGIAGYLAKLNSVFGFKAPLIAALPAPFYLVFGRRWHAAYLVNIVSMLALFWVLYRIAGRWWSERAALFAIAIAGSMPLLYGLSRWYMVEYAMAALLSLGIWLLIESRGLEQRSMTLSFGLVCGFGMLLKVTFAAFILPVFLYFWIASRRRRRSLSEIAAPCLLVALPWYAGHWRPTIRFALDGSFGALASNYGTGPIFAIRTLTAYLSNVAVSGVSVYVVILTALLILWTACRREARARFLSVGAKTMPVLFFWLLPFALFLFGANKEIRLIAPLLPAVALLIAYLLDSSLPRNRAGAALAVLLLGIPVVHLLAVSFGVPYRAKTLTYARRFAREPWPHDAMLNLIAANTRLKPGETALLLVGADRPAFNANSIELTATALRLPIRVETTAHETHFETLRQRLAQASFFVFAEGGPPESAVFNPFIRDIVQLVRNDGRYTEIPFAQPLPDGSTARIFKAAPPPTAVEGMFARGGAQTPEDFAIDFGGVLALTGISTVKTPAATTVQFRWRCLKPPDRDYWCFTHLIDAEGKIVAQLDHRLLGGDPPLTSWRAGDTGVEEVRLLLPPGVPSDGLRMRFGLYDPPSGDRLQVGSLSGRAASRFQLIDRATALLSLD